MADEIRGWCAVITKIARADLQSRLDTYEAGISAIEHGILRHLSRGVSSMAEISQLMATAPSTLVYAVDGLVKKGLVRRRKDPKDRRREPLSLEKRGAALFDSIPKMDANSVLVKSLEGMAKSQRYQLIELLNQFTAGLPGTEHLHMHSESGEGDRLTSGSSRKGPPPASKGRGIKS
jgi:MarR family transcriptional regulator for hemolysin